MEIKYLAHASFLIRGKSGVVVCDPYRPEMTGINFPKVDADIVTLSHSHEDHNAVNLVGGNPIVFDIPGEYEKNGIRITGYSTYHDNSQGNERGKNVLFKIEMEEISILHCGDLGHTLNDDVIEEIDGVDVLLIPVGGVYTIGAEEASQVVSKIEPSFVIPMHYANPKLNSSVFGQLASVDNFLLKRGISEAVEPTKKLILKKSDIIDEET